VRRQISSTGQRGAHHAAQRFGRLAVKAEMKMRAIVCSALMALTITTAGAQPEGCTQNHELYRIVPEYRAVMLDGGDIKRVMFVDWKDERLKTWKPGHNITFCPDEDKMINTNINSVATFQTKSSFLVACKPLLISDAIDRFLETAWEEANKPNGYPRGSINLAEDKLGWYYKVCTDHEGLVFSEKHDFPEFLYVAASLIRINMSLEDPSNANTYKARADKYESWQHALYAAESKKSWARRIWESLTAPR
jgi:hypothetical protein